MIFWLVAAAMLAVALALVLLPLLRRDRTAAAPPADYDLAVYRDQLRELEREVERGVIAANEAGNARLEIERRVLAAGAAPAKAAGARTSPKAVAAALVIGVPIGALALYLATGSPGVPEAPFAARTSAPNPAPTGTAEPDLPTLVQRLADRLAQNPTDPNGWLLLGRSYESLGRYKESVEAYRQALAHGAPAAETQSLLGEALVSETQGTVSQAALAAFQAAIAGNPADPRARYYVALARFQEGHPQEALELWVKLEADAPADASWRAAVSSQIDSTARSLGLDPAKLAGRAAPQASAPGPSEADIEAAGTMSPEQRAAFIHGMVERLAARLQAEPNDIEGWLRLARARRVLGENAAARDAWARAAALAPDRADILVDYAQSILDAQKPGEPLPAEFAAAAQRIRALDPQNRLGLFYAGLVEMDAGHGPEARRLWQQLLAQLPEGSPERAELQRRLDALGGGG